MFSGPELVGEAYENPKGLLECWKVWKLVELCACHFNFLCLDFIIYSQKEGIRSEVLNLAAHEE